MPNTGPLTCAILWHGKHAAALRDIDRFKFDSSIANIGRTQTPALQLSTAPVAGQQLAYAPVNCRT